MTDLQKEFKKYAREEFDCDVVEVPKDEADTFEKLFDANFLQLNKQGGSKILKVKADRIDELERFGFYKTEQGAYTKLTNLCQILVNKENREIVKFNLSEEESLSIEYYIADLITADMVEE